MAGITFMGQCGVEGEIVLCVLCVQIDQVFADVVDGRHHIEGGCAVGFHTGIHIFYGGVNGRAVFICGNGRIFTADFGL